MPNKTTIINRLRYAQDWLRSGEADKDGRRDISKAVLDLLSQSYTRYDQARLNARTLDQLIDLVISDVDCTPKDFECPEELEQFTIGDKLRVAKKDGQQQCCGCGKRFRAARSRSFCSVSCRNRTNSRKHRRKSLGIADVSKAA